VLEDATYILFNRIKGERDDTVILKTKFKVHLFPMELLFNKFK
jgi:hypothetical protein